MPSLPASKPLPNAFVYLAMAGRSCNLSKGSKTVDKWRAALCLLPPEQGKAGRLEHPAFLAVDD
jgi:hypothetical protein